MKYFLSNFFFDKFVCSTNLLLFDQGYGACFRGARSNTGQIDRSNTGRMQSVPAAVGQVAAKRGTAQTAPFLTTLATFDHFGKWSKNGQAKRADAGRRLESRPPQGPLPPLGAGARVEGDGRASLAGPFFDHLPKWSKNGVTRPRVPPPPRLHLYPSHALSESRLIRVTPNPSHASSESPAATRRPAPGPRPGRRGTRAPPSPAAGRDRMRGDATGTGRRATGT